MELLIKLIYKIFKFYFIEKIHLTNWSYNSEALYICYYNKNSNIDHLESIQLLSKKCLNILILNFTSNTCFLIILGYFKKYFDTFSQNKQLSEFCDRYKNSVSTE